MMHAQRSYACRSISATFIYLRSLTVRRQTTYEESAKTRTDPITISDSLWLNDLWSRRVINEPRSRPVARLVRRSHVSPPPFAVTLLALRDRRCVCRRRTGLATWRRARKPSDDSPRKKNPIFFRARGSSVHAGRNVCECGPRNPATRPQSPKSPFSAFKRAFSRGEGASSPSARRRFDAAAPRPAASTEALLPACISQGPPHVVR